jgi:hypothetical protein
MAEKKPKKSNYNPAIAKDTGAPKGAPKAGNGFMYNSISNPDKKNKK